MFVLRGLRASGLAYRTRRFIRPAGPTALFTKVERSLATTEVRPRNTLLRVAQNERQFLVLLAVFFFVAGAFSPYPEIARWVGFIMAAYSTVANDSIQTVGVFIASNKHRPWWVLWLFIGGVFLLTAAYSWVVFDGDVTYGRLASKGFETTPESFSFLQLAAPIFLLIITRMRMPVSTTFLILSCFATEAKGLQEVLIKSLGGYALAFVTAVAVWAVVGRLMKRVEERPMHPAWVPLQWVATGILWATWIMQDAANLAVYLPRQINVAEFIGFASVVVAGLGILFYLRGDRIQRVVDEKSSVVDIRSATVIDMVYAVILFGFVRISPVPMSTTWVFIGLLAGRELTLILRGAADRSLREGFRLAGRDVLYATLGLLISILIAVAANPVVREALLGL